MLCGNRCIFHNLTYFLTIAGHRPVQLAKGLTYLGYIVSKWDTLKTRFSLRTCSLCSLHMFPNARAESDYLCVSFELNMTFFVVQYTAMCNRLAMGLNCYHTDK